MDRARWERIQSLFHDATNVPEAERRVFLDARCGDDPTIVSDVLAMLEQDARDDSLLDRKVADVARHVVETAEPSSLLDSGFGAYRITRMLGEGGMGVVYLAERDDLQSRAAIKILRDAWLSPARRERFRSEQRTLAQLNHPSIAQLFDADTLPDGTPWFVMEYVEGVPLTDYCRTHGVSIPQRLALFRAVCEAVLYTHQHAVIHRDLKPSNVLVRSDGSVKLLDFGIAKQLENLDMSVDQTRSGARLMTPAYASPEQIAGEPVGIHTDVYSLGVILYELLAGRLPFDLANRTPTEVEAIVTKTEPAKPSIAADAIADRARAGPSIRAEGKSAWEDLDVLCLTAMHKDPVRRYRTVEALIRDIDHYLANEPLEARPDTVRYRLGKFAQRNWRALSAAAAGLVILIGIVVFYTLSLVAARNSAVAAAARTERIQEFMTKLFEGGDPVAGPSDSLRVVTLLDRGVQEARSLDGEPAVQAELYLTLGRIYNTMGRLDLADSLFTAALAQRRTLLGSDHRDVATSLVALGLLRADQTEFDEAERMVREGLAIYSRTSPEDAESVARATIALGIVFEYRGEYEPAIEVLNEAVRLGSAAGLSRAEVAEALTQLANCHFYAGHFAVSDSLNREVLATDRVLYGGRHPHVASDLINLGAIQQEWGHYDEGESFYREALDIYREWYGNDHFETASTMTMLARALIPQGRLNEASALLGDARVIRERVYGPDHPQVASTLNELGRVAQQEGRLDEAEAYYRRMADIYKTAYQDKHYLIGVALSNLGSVMLDRNEPRRAEELFREVVRRFEESLSAEHPYMGITRVKLGRALLRQRRYADAEIESRAGYEILIKQTDPSVSWVRNAQVDLIEEYVALNDPEQAARFRKAVADTAGGASGGGS